jgi:hypothetical protein
VVIGLEILKVPTPDVIYEGTKVDMSGFRVAVRYMDGTVGYAATSQLSVYPPIYDWSMTVQAHANVGETNSRGNNNYYTLVYTEGGRAYTDIFTADAFGDSRIGGGLGYNQGANPWMRLVDIEFTGKLNKQEYLVDDIPDFRGIAVEGVYTKQGWEPGDGAGAGQTQRDVVKKKLEFSPDYTEWGWVYNSSTAFVDDRPGILIRVGSYGDLQAGVNGGGTKTLEGLRIPVTRIFQVDKLEFVPETPDFGVICIDDPTLISGLRGTGGRDTVWSRNRWIEVLGDTKVRVSYLGTSQTREWSVEDMLTINAAQTIPGYWGIYSDPADEDLNTRVWEAPVLEWSGGGNTDDSTVSFAPAAGGPTKLVGVIRPYGLIPSTATDPDARNHIDEQWEAWANGKAPKIGVNYRGKKVSVTVPIYNKLQSITAESRSGGPVIMNGKDLQSHKPDGVNEFLEYVKITATYTLNIDSTKTYTREDLWADIGKGICSDGLVSAPVGSSANLGSVLDIDANGGKPPILNKDSVDAYVGKGKEAKVTISFTPQKAWGVSGVETTAGGKKTTFNIGVIGDYRN